MGAIVGAAYATGSRPPNRRIITGVEWKDILASAPREEIPLHRKSRDFAFTNGLEFGLKDGKVIAPADSFPPPDRGMFRRIVAGSDGRAISITCRFRSGPLPRTRNRPDGGLHRGDLAVAMRASMAVPAAFAPWNIRAAAGGWMLCATCGRRGAQDLRGRRDRGAGGQPRVQRTSWEPSWRRRPGDEHRHRGQRERQLATLTDRDVQIKVVLKDIGSSDFSKVPEAIPIGEAAARAAATTLSRYSLPEREYAQWREGLGRT